MSQYQRTPGAYVVDVLVAIDIPDLGSHAALNEERVTSDARPGPGRTVDTAGNKPSRGIKVPCRLATYCHLETVSLIACTQFLDLSCQHALNDSACHRLYRIAVAIGQVCQCAESATLFA